jgi:hypothetical protein
MSPSGRGFANRPRPTRISRHVDDNPAREQDRQKDDEPPKAIKTQEQPTDPVHQRVTKDQRKQGAHPPSIGAKGMLALARASARECPEQALSEGVIDVKYSERIERVRRMTSPVAVEGKAPLPNRVPGMPLVIQMEAFEQIAADVGEIIAESSLDRLGFEIVGVEDEAVSVIASEVPSEALEQIPPLVPVHPLRVGGVLNMAVVNVAMLEAERRAVEVGQERF